MAEPATQPASALPSAPTNPLAKELGVSDCCLKGNQFDGTPAGRMIHLGGLDAYVASPPGQQPKEGRAIVLLYDIFGFGLNNPKIIADELATRLGVSVYAPDYLKGGWVPETALRPFLKETPNSTPAFSSTSLLGKIISVGAMVPNLFSVVKAVRTTTLFDGTETFLRTLRTKKALTHIGVVGFCLGGTQAIYAASDATLIDAAVIAHPGPIPPDDKLYAGIAVPTSWIFAEEDKYLTPSLRAKLVAYHSSPDRHPTGTFEHHLYPGTVHGFASRPALHVPEVKQAYEDALGQVEGWGKKWVVDA